MTPLLTIIEAAPLLGKTPNGVRELVERSRRAADGFRVNGETIRFCQDGKGGIVRFKSEWIEEYLERTTINPVAELVDQSRYARRRPRASVNWDDV